MNEERGSNKGMIIAIVISAAVLIAGAVLIVFLLRPGSSSRAARTERTTTARGVRSDTSGSTHRELMARMNGRSRTGSSTGAAQDSAEETAAAEEVPSAQVSIAGYYVFDEMIMGDMTVSAQEAEAMGFDVQLVFFEDGTGWMSDNLSGQPIADDLVWSFQNGAGSFRVGYHEWRDFTFADGIMTVEASDEGYLQLRRTTEETPEKPALDGYFYVGCLTSECEINVTLRPSGTQVWDPALETGFLTEGKMTNGILSTFGGGDPGVYDILVVTDDDTPDHVFSNVEIQTGYYVMVVRDGSHDEPVVMVMTKDTNGEYQRVKQYVAD